MKGAIRFALSGASVPTDVLEGIAALERGDYAVALRELRPLAEQGFADAQAILGAMYEEGKGVAQDYIQAHIWFNLAAATLPASEDPNDDREIAARQRDELAGKMTPAQVARAQELARNFRPKPAAPGR